MKKNVTYYPNTKINKNDPIIVQLEVIAASSDLTLEKFSFALWDFLSNCKGAMNKAARELNVYPYLPNVHYEIKAQLTAGVNVDGFEPNPLY